MNKKEDNFLLLLVLYNQPLTYNYGDACWHCGNTTDFHRSLSFVPKYLCKHLIKIRSALSVSLRFPIQARQDD